MDTLTRTVPLRERRRAHRVALGALVLSIVLAAAGSPGMHATADQPAPTVQILPSPTPDSHVVVDVFPPDFIQVGKAVFFPGGGSIGRPLEDRDLGPEIGRVQFVDTGPTTLSVCGFLDDYPDDTIRASFVPADEPVYAVAGYEPWFRVAARRRGELVLFEVGCRAGAQVGRDLLDIDGKVAFISVYTAEPSSVTEVTSITESKQVALLVELVLAAPIDPSFAAAPRPIEPPRRYLIAFHLIDGTATTRAFWPATGELWEWIATPPEFVRAIDAAVSEGTPVASGTPSASPPA